MTTHYAPTNDRIVRVREALRRSTTLRNPYEMVGTGVSGSARCNCIIGDEDKQLIRSVLAHGGESVLLQQFIFRLCQVLRENNIQAYDPTNDELIAKLLQRLDADPINLNQLYTELGARGVTLDHFLAGGSIPPRPGCAPAEPARRPGARTQRSGDAGKVRAKGARVAAAHPAQDATQKGGGGASANESHAWSDVAETTGRRDIEG